MTTAEFIIGHSADDAAERKQEARKIIWALLAALAIHLVIGYSLAVFGGLLYAPFSVTEDDQPVELTFLDLATQAPPKNTRLVPFDESKPTRPFIRGWGGDANRPVSKNDVRFNWFALVRLHRTESRSGKSWDDAGSIFCRSQRTGKESQGGQQRFKRSVCKRLSSGDSRREVTSDSGGCGQRAAARGLGK